MSALLTISTTNLPSQLTLVLATDSISTGSDGSATLASTQPASSQTSQPSTSAQPTSQPSSTVAPTSAPSTTVASTASSVLTSTLSSSTSTTRPPTSSTPSSSTSSPSTTASSPSKTTLSSSSTASDGITTSVVSTYTTVSDGSTFVVQTLVPSIIPTSSSDGSDDRASIIGGSAAGAALFIICLMAIAFYLRRRHVKRRRILDAIHLHQTQAHKRTKILDGEDLDDDINLPSYPPPGLTYHGYQPPWDPTSPQRSWSQHSFTVSGSGGFFPHSASFPPQNHESFHESDTLTAMGSSGGSMGTLYQPWRTDVGSVFHEDMYPPPSEQNRLMDTLPHGDELDLGNIIDDVMGHPAPSFHQEPEHEPQPSGSLARQDKAVNPPYAELFRAAGLNTHAATPEPLPPLPPPQGIDVRSTKNGSSL